jgi:uncharacterized protein
LNGTGREFDNGVIAIALALSLLIGVSLGLLGGGGSILTLPTLSYVLGMDTKSAIASSLGVVAVTSAVGVVAHARKGRVRWGTGLTFGAAGMVGSFLGGRLSTYLSAQLLMLLFAMMMIAAAVAMLRGRQPRDVAIVRELAIGKTLLAGVTVGVATGCVGAGGGFMVVPALVLLGGVAMDVAVGTSLLVISMQSLAGFLGHLEHVDIDWKVTLWVAAMAVLGSFGGAAMTGRVPPAALRKGFGIFVLIVAAFVIAKELL